MQVGLGIGGRGRKLSKEPPGLVFRSGSISIPPPEPRLRAWGWFFEQSPPVSRQMASSQPLAIAPETSLLRTPATMAPMSRTTPM
ncbi:hypothetical protein DPM19_22470 [Actinomadura craniellae]|uniref:Uncharacterized protein n=1 Tax=Actinomadura craniellae TaxID=2231787 RepID=A0A365H133_9ACTN|nr:hypothetical protein DPM19_22470 [Actinomadura craniellae]